MVWAMTYMLSPVTKDTKTKTWGDVMVLRMGKIEELEVRAYGGRTMNR